MNYRPVTRGKVRKGDQIRDIYLELSRTWCKCVLSVGLNIDRRLLSLYEFRRPVKARVK